MKSARCLLRKKEEEVEGASLWRREGASSAGKKLQCVARKRHTVLNAQHSLLTALTALSLPRTRAKNNKNNTQPILPRSISADYIQCDRVGRMHGASAALLLLFCSSFALLLFCSPTQTPKTPLENPIGRR